MDVEDVMVTRYHSTEFNENEENDQEERTENEKRQEGQEEEDIGKDEQIDSNEEKIMKIKVYSSKDHRKKFETEYDEDKNKEEEKENGEGSTWFPFRITNIMEPTINTESLSEIISSKYNNFNQANSSLFDVFENLLLKSNESIDTEKKEKKDELISQANGTTIDSSCNEQYAYINYAIYSINKELAANIEMEAVQMMKLHTAAYNNYKNDINFKEDVYQDIINEAEEYATLTLDEKTKKPKRIFRMEFIMLMNINSDNYKNIIGSQTVCTPKMNLDELFKITVN